MNCPNCGKEILQEDAPFCPHCGNSMEVKQKSSDLVLVAAVLTIIAAAFSAGLGYGAIDQYLSLVPLYEFSLVVDYLALGIVNIVAFALAIAGAILMLKRKFIIISMVGVILPLVTVFSPYLLLQLQQPYQYGIVEISMIIFSILSGIFLITSRDEFA